MYFGTSVPGDYSIPSSLPYDPIQGFKKEGDTMLVLTRKLGENIRIGDSVKITILEVRSGQVKLGIEAPPEVPVHREEIYARIQEERRRGKDPPPNPPASPQDTVGQPDIEHQRPNHALWKSRRVRGRRTRRIA